MSTPIVIEDYDPHWPEQFEVLQSPETFVIPKRQSR
jgi:hypothetical protein